LLLLAILELEVHDPWPSMQRDCTWKGTTKGPEILPGSGKVQIVLHLLLCFAEQGISAEFDESVHISLLSCFDSELLSCWTTRMPQPWDTITHDLSSRIYQFAIDSHAICSITLLGFLSHVASMNSSATASHSRNSELTSRILATSDSRELSQLFPSRYGVIETVFSLNLDIIAYCPLLERLTRSDQFRSLVTETLQRHPGLMQTLWSVWMENKSSFIPNKYLWGVWANLPDWVLSTQPTGTLVRLIGQKLQELYVGKNMGFGYFRAYDKLKLKFEKTVMKPTDIRFTQDSFGRKLQA